MSTLFKSVNESLWAGVTIEMNTIKQYFPVELFIMWYRAKPSGVTNMLFGKTISYNQTCIMWQLLIISLGYLSFSCRRNGWLII